MKKKEIITRDWEREREVPEESKGGDIGGGG